MQLLKRIRYIYVLLIIFVVFNCLIFYSLKDDEVVQGDMKPKIVLISHMYSNPYWQYLKQGAEKAAEERNAVVEFQGPDTPSIEEGIKLINMAYAAKVNGLMVYVQDESQYKPVIKKVIESGIPLVTVDSDAEDSQRIAYVGTDNIAAGKEAAKELIKQIGTEGKVAVIMGGRNAKNQVERVNAFQEYLNNNSQLHVSVIESSDAYLLQAELAAEKILSNNKDIRALFCASAQDGIGAAKAISKLGQGGKVKIIAFDDLPETLDYISEDIITATIVQRPYLMGYRAVNIIMDRIEGKDTKGIFLTDTLVVKKENLEHYRRGQGDYAGKK